MLKQLVNLSGAIAVLALAVWPFVQQPGPALQADNATQGAADVMASSTPLPCLMDTAGELQLKVFGSISAETRLTGDDLLCGGDYNYRTRLVFQGAASSGFKDITLILSINSELEPGTQRDVPTNITIMNTLSGDFFSAQSADRCWSDINLVPLVSNDGQSIWKASGTSYCAGALPQIAGRGSVTIGELQFTGRMVDISAD